MDAQLHDVRCRRKTHKNGKWCWLPEEIASMKKQQRELKSWKTISESFTVNGIKRHGIHQCATKSYKLGQENRGY
ncbi:hypothetical protein VM1G_04834 [Cytospora mali]|uniref:Myb-like domain-containing protein n=1 Tax=Cytospora mali TaxID=578113 RepID=A0A194W0Q2_CYTMA|nr:hypothetical protein VM1G_04834 [Valsa mali]